MLEKLRDFENLNPSKNSNIRAPIFEYKVEPFKFKNHYIFHYRTINSINCKSRANLLQYKRN